ncbi:ABC transporter permease [Paraburkholderia phenoliruptrix]|uniref:ABC transporter permease n=1 Tax=Paraburkholderia phenoliruptrix TaxID=252970 RepID=UPI0028546C4A|nr:ABC transporter permease [Paraburkholderia phenoliruptrix]MDR6388250.1 ribose transport system permease protein [Paraburkholderia phenoliruptrix]MDR6420336.1 ribose transport system permease protein [Paraburkholderia phenoliruptrix]WMY07595.1 ABC transporter permease [Paraburkholderia phenoliruptrix]
MKSQVTGRTIGADDTAWSRLRSVQAPWAWSFVGAVLVWLGIVGVFGFGIASNVAQTALTYGVFMVLVGLGQMLVITSGVGNIDLSVPSTIALAGVIGMHVMGGADGRIVLGVVAALGVGVAVGLANYMLIRLLRIPPIIATLSSSFIIQSIAITQGRQLPPPPPALGAFATGRFLNVPYIALLALALSAALAVLLHRAVYGRKLSAIGQNARAAWLAGVDVHRTRCVAYVLCSMIAALTALLLAATSGGASLDMGVEYMLISIAVVVIGGTLVAGGKATIVGVWGASMFLFLTNAALNALGADAGVRSIVYGVLIIAVTVAAGGKTVR